MRILISGASGFIGKALLHQLASEKHDVLSISRLSTNSSSGRLKWVVADLADTLSYRARVMEFSPEIVLHMAWSGIPDFSNENSLRNLQISIDFLQLAMSTKHCRKVIVAGSCFELNQTSGECFESSAGRSKDPFTWAKNALHDWLTMETIKRGIQMIWMRVFYVYGPYQRSGSLLPTVLDHLRRKDLPPLKAPNNRNDFVYVDDIARGFINAIDHDRISGVFNLGSGKAVPVIDVCRIAESLIWNSTVLSDRLVEAAGQIEESLGFWANVTRSNQMLDWSPQISLEEGISRTWTWFEANNPLIR
jgi:nucleoside-diphosphate-sugar epimerase